MDEEVGKVDELITPSTKVVKLGERPATRELKREWTASWIAGSLLGLFVLTISIPIVSWAFGKTPPSDFISFVKDAITIEATLLGTIIGFYFSQKRLGR